MNFSDAEKLILAMLAEIHHKLEIKDGIDPGFVMEAIYSDNTWGLAWRYPGIFESRETPHKVKEMVNIVDMWSFIESSYAKLSKTDKNRVAKEAGSFGKDPKFAGFDGNSEGEYYSTVLFLINHLDRFKEFKGRDLNSHTPFGLDGYKRMYAIFEVMRPGLANTGQLSASQLIELLNERVHPENR
jgi:uncharacterized protein